MAKMDEAVVVFNCKIRVPGITRKVSSADVRVSARGVEEGEARDPEASEIRVSKAILSSPEYGAIRAHAGAIRGFLRSQALPTRLAGGQYMVPVALVEKIDERVSQMAVEFQALVSTFMDAYPRLVEEAKVRLGDLFDEDDYATEETMRDAFSVETSIAALEVPGAGLAQVSKALYAREMKKVEAAREKMVEEIRDGMRVAMADLVSGLVEKLAPSDGSKPKVMASQVEKLQAFVRDFSSLNVAGDEKLAALVEDAKSLVAGVAPEKLRASLKTRDALVGGLRRVREALDGMITADSAALRGSALELSDDAPAVAGFKPAEVPAGLRSVDLEENAAKAAPAPENPGRLRVVDLEERETSATEEPVRAARALELD